MQIELSSVDAALVFEPVHPRLIERGTQWTEHERVLDRWERDRILWLAFALPVKPSVSKVRSVEIVSEGDVHGAVILGEPVPLRACHPTSPAIAEYLLLLPGGGVQDWTKALGGDVTSRFGGQRLAAGMTAHAIVGWVP